MSRHDRTGERIDDDDDVVRPSPTLWDDPAASATPVPERRCELCGTTLAPITGAAWCRECNLLVSARLRVPVQEPIARPLGAGRFRCVWESVRVRPAQIGGIRRSRTGRRSAPPPQRLRPTGPVSGHPRLGQSIR
jgi:hypothetical protein